MFATTFYLMGFSVYLLEIIRTLGYSPGRPITALSLSMCGLLTGINIIGTKNAGKFQNVVVLVTLHILAVFVLYGLSEILSGSPETSIPHVFAPLGYLPVVTRAALVFTSFSGLLKWPQ
ncbi:MAG: hypothetical protein ABEK50_08980 [bacterium]